MYHLSLPFLYTATVIFPRKRNPQEIPVKGVIAVNIKEANSNEFKPAFETDDGIIYSYLNKLWELSITNIESKPVSIDGLINLHKSEYKDYPFSSPTNEAPFFRFWQNSFNDICTNLRYTTLDEVEDCKDSLKNKVREYLSDNREEMVSLAWEIADNRVVFNGEVYETVREPFYRCHTFGLGNNHGGTGLLISGAIQNDILEGKNAFTANQYEEAVEYAKRIAVGRGDTESLKGLQIKPIKVFMPEMVTLKRADDLLASGELEPNEVLSLFDSNKISSEEAAVYLWSSLGDIPVGGDDISDDEIDIEWLDFERGTERFDIWHWFEERFDISVIDLMQGVYKN